MRTRQTETTHRIKERDAQALQEYQSLDESEILALDSQYLALFKPELSRNLKRTLTIRTRCLNALSIKAIFGVLINPYK